MENLNESHASVPGWPVGVRQIHYPSDADGTLQPALIYTPQTETAVPLLVALHTWSSDYRQSKPFYAEWCQCKGWNMIHPDFRGPNNRPEACGSDLAVQDVLSAVAYARKTLSVDPDRIYLVGVSGGGHMALLMAGRASHLWAGVSAWCGISDLAAWHQETKAAGHCYWQMLEAVCGGAPSSSPEVDAQYRHRSPTSWLPQAKAVPLDIHAGITDGHTGSVPVSQSLYAFNSVAEVSQHITDAEITALNAHPEMPLELRQEICEPLYGTNSALWRRHSGQARVTLFQGGHQILPEVALTWLNAQRKGVEAVWKPLPCDITTTGPSCSAVDAGM